MRFLTEPEDWLLHPGGYEALTEGDGDLEWIVLSRNAGNQIVARAYLMLGTIRDRDRDIETFGDAL